MAFIDSLGVFVHFGNALWNLVRAANKKRINVLQILNGILGVAALSGLLFGLVVRFRNQNAGIDNVIIGAIITMFVVAVADYFIEALSPTAGKQTEENDAPDSFDSD